MNKNRVMEMVHHIIAYNKPSDLFLIQTQQFLAGEIELPYEELVVYNACVIYRNELPNHLNSMIKKLQNYIDYDLKRKAKLDFIIAQDMINDCDNEDLESIVKTMSKLDYDQLNIIGY